MGWLQQLLGHDGSRCTADARRDGMRRDCLRDERGAVLLLGVPLIFLLIGMVWYVVGIGDAIIAREQMQDAADTGALSGAIMHARAMNLIALVNLIMAALVAVLVSIRVFQILMLAATTIAAALSWITGGASMAAVPPATQAANAAQQAYNALENVITPLVQGLHYFELGIKYAMPAAAQVRVIESVGFFSPPARVGFAVPGSYPMPVEKATWPELCGKAGELAAKMAMFPITSTIGDNPVTDVLTGAVKGLTKSMSPLFCKTGEGGGAQGIGIPDELPDFQIGTGDNKEVFPKQASSAQCKYKGQAECYDSDPTGQSEDSRKNCKQAAADARDELWHGTGSAQDISLENAGAQQTIDGPAGSGGVCQQAAYHEAMAAPDKHTGHPNSYCEYANSDTGGMTQCPQGCVPVVEEGEPRPAPCEWFEYRIDRANDACAPANKSEYYEWEYQHAQRTWRAFLVPLPIASKDNIPEDDADRFYTIRFEQREADTEFSLRTRGTPPCGDPGGISNSLRGRGAYRTEGYKEGQFLCSAPHFYPDADELERTGGEGTKGLTLREWRQMFEGDGSVPTGWTPYLMEYEPLKPEGWDRKNRGKQWPPKKMRPPHVPENTVYFDGSWEAVTYVTGCFKKVAAVSKDDLPEDIPPANGREAGGHQKPDACGEGDMVHHKMKPGLVLGHDDFQIRSMVFGTDRQTPGREIVRRVPARLPGQHGQGGGFWEGLADAPTLFFAQAEYYVDVAWKPDQPPELDPDEWVWKAAWRARLRRFRLPGASGGNNESDGGDSQGCGFDSATTDIGSACGNAGGGSMCGGGLLEGLGNVTDMLIVH